MIKSASIKLMNSYDYGHFEVCLGIENDDGISLTEVDDARKEAQRLVDKSIRQYKIAKEMASKRTNAAYTKNEFKNQCLAIELKSREDRTIKEIAMLKQYQDENWEDQFNFDYDYED